MKIETNRLILRPPRKEDWKDILEGASDLNVARMTTIIPHPYKEKDAKEYVSWIIKRWANKDKKDSIFFIELKSEKKIIGITSIHNINKFNGNANTGSWINRKYWRNGYILEAKIPVLDFAFNQLKLRKIETSAFVENKASNSMSKKLGFKLEGTKRKTVVCKSTGKIHDKNEYGLLKEEWKKIRPRLIKELRKKIK